MFWVWGSGVLGLGFWCSGFGVLGVLGLGFWCSGFLGSGCSGFGVLGVGFGVWGSWALVFKAQKGPGSRFGAGPFQTSIF